jgi:hypothetical protein
MPGRSVVEPPATSFSSNPGLRVQSVADRGNSRVHVMSPLTDSDAVSPHGDRPEHCRAENSAPEPARQRARRHECFAMTRWCLAMVWLLPLIISEAVRPRLSYDVRR